MVQHITLISPNRNPKKKISPTFRIFLTQKLTSSPWFLKVTKYFQTSDRWWQPEIRRGVKTRRLAVENCISLLEIKIFQHIPLSHVSFSRGCSTRISSYANIDRKHLTKKKKSAWLHIDFHRRHLGIRTWQVQNTTGRVLAQLGPRNTDPLKPATVPGLVCSSTLPGDEPHMCGGQLFFFSVWFVVRWLVLRKNLIQGALKTSKTDKPKVFSLGNNEMRCTSSKMSFPLSRIQGLDRSLYYSSLLLCQKANFFIAKICLSQVSKFLGRE